MYIVTFYSFKGGVGRTMALVNVAAELARRGRKVLVVDFDLEAPGLNTFDLVRPSPSAAGVVDYVWQYLETNRAPEATEYVHRCSIDSPEGGQLWIMPTGRNDAFYANRLNRINWQRLYAEHDGYLLFEDLKAQWKDALRPDYVLIDSRTGHTDVGGICTRHLPDAVVALFFPNEQNLQGLDTVVKQIRAEAASPRKKPIQLHFVTSNVPDLDDEDQILAGRMERFRERLGYTTLAANIHHYDSLALLNQVVFAVERPRSRLAQEYRELARSISRENLEDREGALDYLEKFLPRTHRIAIESPATAVEERLREIRDAHSHDGNILYQVGRILKDHLGDMDQAMTLLNQAAESGYRGSGMMLDRAQLHRLQGNTQAAIADVQTALKSSDSTYFGVSSAIRLLLELDPAGVGSLLESPAFRALGTQEQFLVAGELLSKPEALPTAEAILKELLSVPGGDVERSDIAAQLVLCLIGQGRFTEAMRVISPEGRPDLASLGAQDAFHYAMAEWGETGKCPRDLFERVVQLDKNNPLRESPNNLLCGAIAYWAIGDTQTALERATEAREHVRRTRRPAFSPWRYLKAPPRQFREDIAAAVEMISGQCKVPAFIPSPSGPSATQPRVN